MAAGQVGDDLGLLRGQDVLLVGASGQQHQRREYGYENSAHRRIIVQIYKNNPILQHETQKKPRLACRGKKKTAEAVDYATDNSLSGDFETLNSPLLQIYDAYTDQEGKGEHP